MSRISVRRFLSDNRASTKKNTRRQIHSVCFLSRCFFSCYFIIKVSLGVIFYFADFCYCTTPPLVLLYIYKYVLYSLSGNKSD